MQWPLQNGSSCTACMPLESLSFVGTVASPSPNGSCYSCESLAWSAGTLESYCAADERVHKAGWHVSSCGFLCKRLCSRTK